MAAWVAATPPDFRFSVKAQRGGSFRALQVDPTTSVPWLTGPYRAFGERLGTVLFRVPDGVRRDDAKLAALLAAWPTDMPLTMEFQDPSWHVDETFAALAGAGAALCATELPEDEEPPIIRRTGSFLYLRLRRNDYTDAELDAWAARLEPFLSAGDDVFVFFRHDEVGRGPELAEGLIGAVGADPRLTVGQLPARSPSAGPKTTSSSSRSAMSWNRCGTCAATKTTDPGTTGRVSSPTVTTARPAST